MIVLMERRSLARAGLVLGTLSQACGEEFHSCTEDRTCPIPASAGGEGGEGPEPSVNGGASSVDATTGGGPSGAGQAGGDSRPSGGDSSTSSPGATSSGGSGGASSPSSGGTEANGNATSTEGGGTGATTATCTWDDCLWDSGAVFAE
jgi:hypothetical protein